MYDNNLDLFVTVQISRGYASCPIALENSSKITDNPLSGQVVKSHI